MSEYERLIKRLILLIRLKIIGNRMALSLKIPIKIKE